MRLVLLLTLAMLSALSAPTAVSSASGCAPVMYAWGPPAPQQTVLIVGSGTVVQPSTCGAPELASSSLSCPPLVQVSLPGEWCGPTVAAGASLICSFTPVHTENGFLSLWAGFDADGDGNVGGGEIVQGPWAGSAVWRAFNTGTTSARVILYTAEVGGPGSPLDIATVGCV